MCIYYTLDFHGCGCRLRCPNKTPLKCSGISPEKKRGKFRQRLWEQKHRKQSMVLTWETSKLKCPHCRVVDNFTPRGYKRAVNEGLWVGNEGKVDMKLLEKNVDRGTTDGARVWGKTKRNCLHILYQTETHLNNMASGMSSTTSIMSLQGSNMSSTTLVSPQPPLPQLSSRLSTAMLMASTVRSDHHRLPSLHRSFSKSNISLDLIEVPEPPSTKRTRTIADEEEVPKPSTKKRRHVSDLDTIAEVFKKIKLD